MRDLAAGDHVGDWEIVGPQGDQHAYRVVHRRGAAVVGVLKVVPASTNEPAEVDALARLDHPNIVRLLDHGDTPQGRFLVTENVDGHALGQLQRPVPDALARALVRQLAEALAYAHERGVAHRDVKPDNALVRSDGQLVLIDFGIATRPDRPRLTRGKDRSPGTPRYAPPEWFDGPLQDGAAADAYALGVLAFELLRGTPAFPGDSPEARLARKRQGPATIADAGALGGLIEALTQPNPTLRATMADVLARLEKAPVVPLSAGSTLPIQPAGPSPDRPEVRPSGHRTIGRYEVLGELGRGGTGVVYRAFDPELQRDLAIKIGHADAGARRVRREARAIARLRHPNIVQILDVGEHDGELYLAMELVEGQDLAKALSDGPLAIEEALRITIEVGDALAHAHQRGIVHRDVKPANIFRDLQGVTRLGDFGLALEVRRAARLTGQGEVLGTPLYMAPEQARGDASATGPRTDVYALGAVLFEMVTGRAPVEGDHPAQILHAVLAMSNPPRLAALRSDLPAGLDAVCARAMHPDPAQRYASMRALVADLRHVQQGEPIEGAPNPLQRRVGWWLHVHRAPLRLVGAVALGGLLVVLLTIGARSGGAWRAEAQAAARLDGLRNTIAEHLDRGEIEEADAAFQAFLDVRDNRGTSALAEAWRDRARRYDANEEPEEARRALATAYAEAADATQAEDVLVELMRAQADDWRWRDLRATLSVMEARFPDAVRRADATPSIWRLQVAERRRPTIPAPDESARQLTPLVDALGRARRLPQGTYVRGYWPVAHPFDVDGDGQVELISPRPQGVRVLTVPSFEQVGLLAWPAEVRAKRALPVMVDEEPHLVARGEQRAWLLRMRERDIELLLEWPEPHADAHLQSATVLDLDRDGHVDVLLGSYGRTLTWLRQTADGWQAVEPDGAMTHTNSEIHALSAADLDGDGTVDLAAATGPWGAYDVRLLDWSADEQRIVLRSRDPIGSANGVVPVRGIHGWELVSAAGRGYANPRDFGRANPHGPFSAVYRHRVIDGMLQRVERIPLIENPGTVGPPAGMDLDGDGLQDVAVTAGRSLWLARRTPDDRLVPMVMDGLLLLTSIDVDQDGDDELLVRDSVDDSVWVLGTGQDALPPAPGVSDGGASLRATLGDWMSNEAQRSDDLFAMGFASAGAEHLARVAELTPDPAEAAQARLQAGRYLELHERCHLAAPHYARAAEEPSVQAEALRGVARCAELQHQFPLAVSTYEALGEASRADALRDLADVPTWEITFDESKVLDAFSLLDPVALHLDSHDRQLEITSAGDGAYARLPLTAEGPRLSIQVEGVLHELEWSGGVSFMLFDASMPKDGELVGMVLRGQGGGGAVTTMKWAAHGRQRRSHYAASPDSLNPYTGPFTLRVDWVPTEQRAFVEVDGLGPPLRMALSAEPGPIPNEIALVLGGLSEEGTHQRAVASVTRITVEGARPVPVRPTPERQAAAALVAGLPGDALAVLEAAEPMSDRDETARLRVLALSDLGRWAEAGAVLSTSSSSDAWLMRVVRTGQPGLAPAIADLLGDRAPEVFWRAWEAPAVLRPEDPSVVRALTEGPLATASLHGLPAAVATEILIGRAAAWKQKGKLALASRLLDDAETRVPGDAPILRTEIHVQRAHVALLGSERGATFALLANALAHSPTPEILAERLAVDPRFEALHDAPAWEPTVLRARQRAAR